MYTDLLLKKNLLLLNSCAVGLPQKYEAAQLFSTLIRNVFFKQQISILEWFLKDQITLKTRILLFQIIIILILVFTILNVFNLTLLTTRSSCQPYWQRASQEPHSSGLSLTSQIGPSRYLGVVRCPSRNI